MSIFAGLDGEVTQLRRGRLPRERHFGFQPLAYLRVKRCCRVYGVHKPMTDEPKE